MKPKVIARGGQLVVYLSSDCRARFLRLRKRLTPRGARPVSYGAVILRLLDHYENSRTRNTG